jgi:hypothetical protein
MASIFKKIEAPEMSSFTRRLSCLRAYLPWPIRRGQSWSQDAKQIDQKVKMPPQQPVWQGFGRSHFLIPVDQISCFALSAFGIRSCAAHVHFREESRHDHSRGACLLLRSLLGVKRTCPFALHMSANDPKRTSRLR